MASGVASAHRYNGESDHPKHVHLNSNVSDMLTHAARLIHWIAGQKSVVPILWLVRRTPSMAEVVRSDAVGYYSTILLFF